MVGVFNKLFSRYDAARLFYDTSCFLITYNLADARRLNNNGFK